MVEKENFYALSDGIRALRDRLSGFDATGVIMSGEAVRQFRAQLTELLVLAGRQENEISRCRWNDQAREDRVLQAESVLREVMRPNGNVRLFPVIPRPFHDGGAS